MEDSRPAVAVLDPLTRLGGADLAQRYGLAVSGARPDIVAYTRQLWARRHFILAFASAKTAAAYTTARLGQIWQLLTPLLNSAVYYLIFDLILHSTRGVAYPIAFITSGVFIYTFTQQTVLSGTRAVSDNLNLIRALHFPRACLPIAIMITQFQQMVFSIIALLAITMLSGDGLTVRAPLILVAIFFQAIFNGGLAMIFARVGAKNTDMAQVMPFVLRTWMYLSGVLYDIHSLKNIPAQARTVLELNPMAIYIDLVREQLGLYKRAPNAQGTVGHTVLPHHEWIYAIAWAVGIAVIGFIYFWQSEEEYGRG